MDSLEPEDEEEIPIKRKKSRPLEESANPGKKSEKLKRRQHVEKQSSEGALYILYAYLWRISLQLLSVLKLNLISHLCIPELLHCSARSKFFPPSPKMVDFYFSF